MMTAAAIKKEKIDLKNLRNPTFQEDFLVVFCDSFIPSLRQFLTDYKVAIIEKDMEALRQMVHKIVSSLRFIELEEFCVLLETYKSINLNDQAEVIVLLNDVEQYCIAVEESLLELKSTVI